MASVHPLQDTASVAFQPMCELRDSGLACLTARAGTHWLSQPTFDDWGSFMGLYVRTRQLLLHGGLALEVRDFTRMPADAARWIELRDGWLGDTLPVAELLYLARLLLALGFHADADAVTARARTRARGDEHRLAVLYLEALGASLADSSGREVGSLTDALGVLPATLVYSRLGFHGALLAGSLACRHNDAQASAHWFDLAAEILARADTLQDRHGQNLGRARLYRHRAQLAVADRGAEAARLSDALALVEDDPQLPPSWSYLYAETRRRVLDGLCRHALRYGAHDVASDVAQRIVAVDAHCARAQLLAGICAVARADHDAARHAFTRVVMLGPIERPYALAILARLERDPLRVRVAFTEAIDLDIFDTGASVHAAQAACTRACTAVPVELDGVIDAWLAASYPAGSTRPLEPPIGAEIVAALVDRLPHLETPAPVLERGFGYAFARPFWTLTASAGPMTIAAHAPLRAWDAFAHGEEPFFTTCHLQRVMVTGFREDLYFAMGQGLALAHRDAAFGCSPAALRGRSVVMDRFLAEAEHALTQAPLQRALLARVYGALGFPREGRRLLGALPSRGQRWSPEERYLAMTDHFLRTIHESGEGRDYAEDLAALHAHLGEDEHSLRLQLVIAMHGAVHHGQRREAAKVAVWRERGLAYLRAIERCARFDDFEVQLLTSRLYRGISYHPFLIGDREVLAADAEICERTARQLTPTDARQALLKRENMFPMLESMARIAAFLGDHDRADELMRSIARDVDPLDVKAWLQVGDAAGKRGRIDDELHAFLTAGALAVPDGKIAWFRAGRCYERRGEPQRAMQSYLRSLRLGPKGLAPLLRLVEVARREGDAYLGAWATAALERSRAMPGVFSHQITQIDEALAQVAAA